MGIRRYAICLSAAVLALPSLAAAGEAPNKAILALGHSQSHGWLTTTGPDADGGYRMWINISDIDPATDAGWSAMESRMMRGTAMLCDLSGMQPQVKGYHNSGERRCWRETREQGRQQMTRAREARRQGRAVTVLGMAAAPAVR